MAAVKYHGLVMRRSAGATPQRVGDLLTAAVPALGEHLIVETIRREWARTVGPDLGRRSRPAGLHHGVLDVRVDSSPGLQEIRLRTPRILEALAARHGPVVTALRPSLGPVTLDPLPMDSPEERRPGAVARLDPAEVRDVESVVAPLADPELKRTLRRLILKDRLARPRPAPGAGQPRP